MNFNKVEQAKIYLLAFTVQDLKGICKKYGIRGFSNLNKDDIIHLIFNYNVYNSGNN